MLPNMQPEIAGPSTRSVEPSARPTEQRRLLALDGGGIRSISSLMILDQLMQTIDPESPPKPCDYFDMIGGTGTGGWVIHKKFNTFEALTG
jgi:hypothetical protein